ncbi:hypothetical protein DFH07DRAFT_860941 [Mycena maculata]|uniref:Uncharacterized protein n=1 Tax=Mycena maculata TaxID=230809 RepID=A0AAD7HCW3_9AGAR|nr:hypothetical protein DFH07DRAFT_860941 [Mycena maculata]
MAFRFTILPTELALEIIRVASLPSDEDATAPRPSYATALALSSVSHAMRSATMPHLLHSVILATSPQVLCFIDSILLQREFAAFASPLTLDYPLLVRRFWSNECWEPLMDDEPEYCINYGALYEVIRGVDSLGLNFRSLHLLYNGLTGPEADPVKDWKCRHVTFAGALPRWNPFKSTPGGIAFLSHITHLTLWIPTHDYPWLPAPPCDSPVPAWVADIPFSSFSDLSHLAFPLLSKLIPTTHKNNPLVFQVPTEMLAYVAPCPTEDFNPAIFGAWALGSDPLSHGVVVPFRTLPSCRIGNSELGWEFPFMWGESDDTWAELEAHQQK